MTPRKRPIHLKAKVLWCCLTSKVCLRQITHGKVPEYLANVVEPYTPKHALCSFGQEPTGVIEPLAKWQHPDSGTIICLLISNKSTGRLLYGIKRKSANSLTFDLHCLVFNSVLSSYVRTLPNWTAALTSSKKTWTALCIISF